MAIHSSILAWKSHGQRRLAGYSPWGRKQLDVTEQLTVLMINDIEHPFVHSSWGHKESDTSRLCC